MISQKYLFISNKFAAVVLAPYFVLLEVLFSLGFYRDLKKKVDVQSKKRIGQWKSEQEKAKKGKK